MARLPEVSGQQAIQAFERLGFQRVRQRGSHVVMRRGNQGCVIPLHHALAIGTLRGILRQARITPAQFLQALSRR